MTTNRSYIYQWIEDEGRVNFFGYGLGNANIVLSASFGNDMIYSFLSLFLNVLYSGGLIGFILLLWIYIKPVIDTLRKYSLLRSREPGVFVALGTYTCMTVSFLGSWEEFNLLFSIPIALMLALKYGPIPDEVNRHNV